MFATTSLLLSLAAGAYAKPTPIHNREQRSETSSNIQWGDCSPELQELLVQRGATWDVFCGNMSVPLDYTNPESNQTHVLEVVRVPASTDGQALGSIIFNFGGPGAQGVDSLALAASSYLNYTGGQYDLVSFNPRGTSPTSLFASCFTPEERMLANQQVLLAEIATDSTRADATFGHRMASAEAYAGLCGERLEGLGEYVGTAFTARDMMGIVDALGEEKLNYWGISYGTILGATVASMFPDRMGRIILDGVVDPYYYYEAYNGPVELEEFDSTIRGILDACVEAGPEVCPLAGDGSVTGAQLEEQVHDLLKRLAERPLVLPSNQVDLTSLIASSYVDSSTIRGLMVSLSYNPGSYPVLLSAIDGLLKGDTAAVVAARDAFSASTASATQSEALLAISCSDKRVERDMSFERARLETRQATEMSEMAGPSVENIFNGMRCAHWNFEAKEKYMGSFERDVSENPFLVIGNTYDPVTPLSSARQVAEGFRGSVLLESNSFGHGSGTQVSQCIMGVTSTYFQTGELPEDGTVCDPDLSLAEELAVYSSL